MKIVERDIFPFQESDLFSPIRSKLDYARVLVLSARMLLLGSINENKHEHSPKLKLVVDKMSRLFFYKQAKYYSISFPFTIIVSDEGVHEISTYSGKVVDFKSISAVLSILDNEQFQINPSLIDFFIEPQGIESFGLLLLEEIFQLEPAYVRYDNDPDNENGKLHPLNHFDLNYSQQGTFKLGLQNSISQAYFEDVHNTTTDCSYVVVLK